jgi:ribosomal protein S24E
MKVLVDVHNTLLSRREVVFSEEYPSNPGFAKVKEDVSAQFKVSPDTVVVRAVRGEFGSSSFTIEARVYDSVEALTLIEPKPKVAKGASS